MTQSSPQVKTTARKNEQILLQAHAKVPNKRIAIATGWHESKVSRFFGEAANDGKTEVAAVADLLAEMGLAVWPDHYQVADPEWVKTNFQMVKLLIQKVDEKDLLCPM